MFAYKHFLKALQSGEMETANTIITNLLNDKPGSMKYLKGYVDFLEREFTNLDLTSMEKSLEIYKKASNKYFVYGYLVNYRLEELKALNIRVDTLKEEYTKRRALLEERNKTTSKKSNEEILSYLESELGRLDEVTDEKEFDKVLEEVKKAEKKLTIASMDENEREIYDQLIDRYASKIATRTRDFENSSLTKYNIACLDSLKELITTFRTSRRRLLKHFEMLKPLLEEKMFSYDTSKLFAATNEYFQYCYTYIFTRLSDENKYEMAKLALTTIKK